MNWYSVFRSSRKPVLVTFLNFVAISMLILGIAGIASASVSIMSSSGECQDGSLCLAFAWVTIYVALFFYILYPILVLLLTKLRKPMVSNICFFLLVLTPIILHFLAFRVGSGTALMLFYVLYPILVLLSSNIRKPMVSNIYSFLLVLMPIAFHLAFIGAGYFNFESSGIYLLFILPALLATSRIREYVKLTREYMTKIIIVLVMITILTEIILSTIYGYSFF